MKALFLLTLTAAMVGAMIVVCVTVNPKELNKQQSAGAAISIVLGALILPNLALIAINRDNYN